MSAQAPAQVKAVSTPAAAVKPTGLASHTCACGGSHGLGDECAECRQKRLRVQRRASKAPDLFATQLKSPAPVALNYHFSRVSVRQAHSEQSGAEREARDEQEADRAAEQLLQGSERLMSQSSTPLAIRRRALDEEEEISAESTDTPESEGTESTTAATTETTPEVAGPETEPTPKTGRGSEPATAETSAGETSIGGLIVEDDVSPGPGQISKDAFLNELRASACAAADAELAAVGRSTGGCPYVERLIGYYRTKSSEHLERAMRKYAPETAGVTKAREYIPLISERIRQGTARWAQTGRISGVPEELLTQVSSAGLLSDIPSAASSALRNVSGLFFKAHAGGAHQDADPQAIRSQLKGGRSLEGGVRARMELAFGYDFSRVRVHTDRQAAHLSSNLNARAFTVGSDVAFGAGEYQPGTVVGDALLAHELAHVVQQGGGESSAAVMQKGGTTYNALEEDADTSAVGAVVSMWSGARSGLAKIAQSAMPRLKSGLRLSRCNSNQQSTPAGTSTSAPTTSTPTGPSPVRTPEGVTFTVLSYSPQADADAPGAPDEDATGFGIAGTPGVNTMQTDTQVRVQGPAAAATNYNVGFIQTVRAFGVDIQYAATIRQWRQATLPSNDAFAVDNPIVHGATPTGTNQTLTLQDNDSPSWGGTWDDPRLPGTQNTLERFTRNEEWTNWLAARNVNTGNIVYLKHMDWRLSYLVNFNMAQPIGSRGAVDEAASQAEIVSGSIGDGQGSRTPVLGAPLSNGNDVSTDVVR